RVGGCRRDLQDAVLLIDLGCRDGDAGVEVADDELDALADELVGDRHALLGIGAVVADGHGGDDLLTEDAAGGIDVRDRLVDAVLELRAEGGAAAGDRAADAEFDLRGGVVRESQAKAEGEAEREPLSHSVYLWNGKRYEAVRCVA